MTRKASMVAAALLSLLASGQALGDNYEVNVTRKASNLYKVTGKDVFIVTRYCYEYVYSEDAILRVSGFSSKLVFLDAGESCDVKSVYGPSSIKPGRYSVTVSRQDDNWFVLIGLNTFVRTTMCLSLALADDAVLIVSAPGVGRLLLIDEDDECRVEGIYVPVNLTPW
jgi:hypothetical protein